MSVSTRSWACKGRRQKSIYQCGPIKSKHSKLISASSHYLYLNHTTLGCSEREQPEEPPRGWALGSVTAADRTRLRRLLRGRSRFNAGLAQSTRTHVCAPSVRTNPATPSATPSSMLMLSFMLQEVLGGQQHGFYSHEDKRLAWQESKSFPHSQQPSNAAQKWSSHMPVVQNIAVISWRSPQQLAGEEFGAACSVWWTPPRRHPLCV